MVVVTTGTAPISSRPGGQPVCSANMSGQQRHHKGCFIHDQYCGVGPLILDMGCDLPHRNTAGAYKEQNIRPGKLLTIKIRVMGRKQPEKYPGFMRWGRKHAQLDPEK